MAESFGAVTDRWCIGLIVVERDGSLVLVCRTHANDRPVSAVR